MIIKLPFEGRLFDRAKLLAHFFVGGGGAFGAIVGRMFDGAGGFTFMPSLT